VIGYDIFSPHFSLHFFSPHSVIHEKGMQEVNGYKKRTTKTKSNEEKKVISFSPQVVVVGISKLNKNCP
jgi:hypothetical protein